MENLDINKARNLIHEIKQIDISINESEATIEALEDSSIPLNSVQFYFGEEHEEFYRTNGRVDFKPIREAMIKVQKTTIRHLNVEAERLRSEFRAL
ncbi:MAG: hypothetical protein GVY20_02005 [Bacteroidetes bacterium]|jgi:phosphoribosylanthranilate isomerase|nr:hypothetical protein [Bacteroidota bacterium]